MQYVYERAGGGVSNPQGLASSLLVAKARIDVGEGPFKGLLDGHPMFEGDRQKTLRRLRAVAAHMSVGETLRVRREGKDDVEFWLRAVEEDIPYVDINGNDHADEFWSWIVARYPQYRPRFAGAYVCKSISGSSSPSQHSYGNAVDVFFESIEAQRIVFGDITHGKCPVPIANAISERLIWQPSDGLDPYGGDPHYHLHCDFLPSYSGGCGVRG